MSGQAKYLFIYIYNKIIHLEALGYRLWAVFQWLAMVGRSRLSMSAQYNVETYICDGASANEQLKHFQACFMVTRQALLCQSGVSCEHLFWIEIDWTNRKQTIFFQR